MKFSILIPAHNEEDNIARTCLTVLEYLKKRNVDIEIIVVNDNSIDKTEEVLKDLSRDYQEITYINNHPPNGFGYAVREGIKYFTGDALCIVMADLSDSPEDIYNYYLKLEEGYECVFGSRFIKGGKTIDYPRHKLILNRIFNFFIRILFNINHNDITNAFKAYKRNVIEGISPLISPHFNLTVEMPLKAIVRGYTFSKIPISWTNRVGGISKLKLKEMGSRYLFIVLYIFLEKFLTKHDYHRKTLEKDNTTILR